MTLKRTLAVLCAFGLLGALSYAADDPDEPQDESPFGKYAVKGSENFDGGKFITDGTTTISKSMLGRVDLSITYDEGPREGMKLSFDLIDPFDGTELEELDRGQSERRRFVFANDLEGDKHRVKGKGWVTLRKTTEGKYEVSITYSGKYTKSTIYFGERFKGGVTGFKADS